MVSKALSQKRSGSWRELWEWNPENCSRERSSHNYATSQRGMVVRDVPDIGVSGEAVEKPRVQSEVRRVEPRETISRSDDDEFRR